MISIIVPVYNAERYIRETIRTVRSQTRQDWELILVDDCSKDRSAEIIEEEIRAWEQSGETSARAYAQTPGEILDATSGEMPGKSSGEMPGGTSDTRPDAASGENAAEAIDGGQNQAAPHGRIRLIRKTRNEGAAKARNTGIEAAEGRYIAFLDADDLWMPSKLEQEMKFMEKHEAGLVFTSYQFGDEHAVPTGKAVHVPPRLSYREALSRTVIFTSTVLADTDKIDKSLLHMPDIGSEDTATWWRILKTGVTAYGLDQPLVVYRRPLGGSLSSDKGTAVKRIWKLYREVAELGPLPAFICLLRWAWRASVRRAVDDTIRSHFETIKRFTVLELSLLGLILHTALYAYVWFEQYYPILQMTRISQDGYDFGPGIKLYFRGHLLILLIYFVVLLFFNRNSGGLRTGYLKPMQLFGAQLSALFLTDALSYAQLSLIRNWLIPVQPILLLFAAQLVLAFVWSQLTDLIYRRVFPPRETLVVYEDGSEKELASILERFQTRQDRFRVMKYVPASLGADRIREECLSWYGCVVLSGLAEPMRRELMEFCYGQRIRVYLLPEVPDILLQGADQLDLFDEPILELREYSISWEQRVVKRALDIVFSLLALVLSSPWALGRAIWARCRTGRVWESTRCLTKSGREFTRHAFAGEGAGKYLPMLFDVLRGSASLVGPEPVEAETARRLMRENAQFAYRFRMKAGITGYAQSYGRRFAGSGSDEDVRDILRLDMVYIQNYSLQEDFRLALTWWRRGK